MASTTRALEIASTDLSKVDSSNWTMCFDPTALRRIYEENGTLSVTFNPPIACKIDTSSGPADAIAIPVSAIAKKKRSRKPNAGKSKVVKQAESST